MTRIKPITDKAQLPLEQQHEWDAVLAERGRVRGPFGVMLHSPGLSLGFLASVHHAHGEGVVSDALHELAILAVAYENDAPYQWSAHIASARAAGLRNVRILLLNSGPQLPSERILGIHTLGRHPHPWRCHPIGAASCSAVRPSPASLAHWRIMPPTPDNRGRRQSTRFGCLLPLFP